MVNTQLGSKWSKCDVFQLTHLPQTPHWALSHIRCHFGALAEMNNAVAFHGMKVYIENVHEAIHLALVALLSALSADGRLTMQLHVGRMSGLLV